MRKLYILTVSLLLGTQPLFAAMTGGGDSGSSGYSNSSSSSTEGGGYSSKKDKKKKEFDPFESIYGLIRLSLIHI